MCVCDRQTDIHWEIQRERERERETGGNKQILGNSSNRPNKQTREHRREEILNKIIPGHFLGLKKMIIHIKEVKYMPSKNRFLKDPLQGAF